MNIIFKNQNIWHRLTPTINYNHFKLNTTFTFKKSHFSPNLFQNVIDNIEKNAHKLEFIR
jgi:hypothetical protein